MNDDIPPCQAYAMQRIRQIPVNGVLTAILMLEETIAEIKEMDIPSEQQVQHALMEKITVYNYIPKAAEEAYSKAILEVYRKSIS